jgi:hypothetical protein
LPLSHMLSPTYIRAIGVDDKASFTIVIPVTQTTISIDMTLLSDWRQILSLVNFRFRARAGDEQPPRSPLIRPNDKVASDIILNIQTRPFYSVYPSIQKPPNRGFSVFSHSIHKSGVCSRCDPRSDLDYTKTTTAVEQNYNSWKDDPSNGFFYSNTLVCRDKRELNYRNWAGVTNPKVI